MKLRHLIAVAAALPLFATLELTACSDNGNPTGADPGTADDGGPGGGGDGDTNPDGGPPGGSGACTVTKPGSAGLLIKGRLLLPGSIEDGELLIDDKGTILCASKTCATPPPEMADYANYTEAYTAATQVTCTDAVISPGLINPHDHITFADVPPKPHGTERYEHRNDWRKGLEGHKKITTSSAPGSSGGKSTSVAELRFVMSGATTGATAGGQDGLLRNVDGSPAQLEGAKIKLVNSETFPLNDSTPPAGWPVDTCGGFSASRDTTTIVQKYRGYLPHISEGVNDVAHLEFACQSDPADPTHDLLAKQTAIIHGVALEADDMKKLRDTQTSLVWSPRSNIDLYGNTAEVVAYDNLGVQIALGTDWLPSGSMNMSRELRCADELNKTYFGGHFTDEQLWKMVTMNGAFAIGAADVLGMLKPGYIGDVAIFNAKTSKDYRAVIDAGVEDVLLVLRAGKPLYGDAALLASDGVGGAACEDLDVCGTKKKACVKQDLGDLSLADLQAEAD
jgi:hypothetical protein